MPFQFAKVFLVALVGALSVLSAARAADADGWDGPGWYYVMATPAGGYLGGGPYPTSEDCVAAAKQRGGTAMDECRYFGAKPALPID